MKVAVTSRGLTPSLAGLCRPSEQVDSASSSATGRIQSGGRHVVAWGERTPGTSPPKHPSPGGAACVSDVLAGPYAAPPGLEPAFLGFASSPQATTCRAPRWTSLVEGSRTGKLLLREP